MCFSSVSPNYFPIQVVATKIEDKARFETIYHSQIRIWSCPTSRVKAGVGQLIQMLFSLSLV